MPDVNGLFWGTNNFNNYIKLLPPTINVQPKVFITVSSCKVYAFTVLKSIKLNLMNTATNISTKVIVLL